MSDPVLYPAPGGTPEALAQEVARTRADLAHTVEELAGRMAPGRLLRPANTTRVAGSVVAGLGVVLALRRRPSLRGLALLGGLAAALAVFIGTGTAARRRVTSGLAPAFPLDNLPAEARDVVGVLVDQHRRIDIAFALVLAASGQDRVEAFASLVDVVRQHERVEQEVVHPALRPLVDEVAEARLAEEKAGDRALASLISKGVHDPDFVAGLSRLRRMVREHADHEETREFPLLRHLPAERLREMAGQVRWSL
jgi:hypothetical protein